jgi:putative membrane protein
LLAILYLNGREAEGMIEIRKTLIACTAAALCGAVGVASAEGKMTGAGKMLTDQNFVTKAGQAGMAEVELSKLALQKSQDDEVLKFAKKMVTDHEKANMELKALAQKQGLAVPKDVDAEHKATMNELKAQSGERFDSAYSMAMQTDHDKAVELFTEAKRSESLNDDLKAFAAKTLPTLEQHHHLAATLPAADMRAASSKTDSSPNKR